MLAELLKILVFQTAEHKDFKGTGLDAKPNAKVVQTCPLRSLHHGDRGTADCGTSRPENNKEPNLIEAIASWEPWGNGCLDGRRREGAILVQQGCQWSAEKAEVTSALRLHDATNAYLSTRHDVAIWQQLRWHSRKWTRHTAWSLLCTAHCCEGNVFSFSTGTAKWRPLKASCLRGADLAGSGPGREGTQHPQGPTAKAESPKEAKSFSTLERSATSCTRTWKAKKTRTGMDDDEETLPKEQHAGKEAGEVKQFRARPRRTTIASR